jgi:hypothetical protein
MSCFYQCMTLLPSCTLNCSSQSPSSWPPLSHVLIHRFVLQQPFIPISQPRAIFVWFSRLRLKSRPCTRHLLVVSSNEASCPYLTWPQHYVTPTHATHAPVHLRLGATRILLYIFTVVICPLGKARPNNRMLCTSQSDCVFHL